KHERFAVLGKDDVYTPVNFQTERAKRATNQFLNLARLAIVDLRGTNVFCARASFRIQKWILGVEVVEAAFGNNFQDRQHLISQNANCELTPRNKFFDQQ